MYEFINPQGDFRSNDAAQDHSLYFPLANELGFYSAITPTLHGDIKLNHHAYLSPPVSIEDLHLSRAGRGFWISGPKFQWNVNGQSPQQKSPDGSDTVRYEAGLLWQKVVRTNKKLGLEATVLNFVPVSVGTFEIMMVDIKNISKKKMKITPTAAIPLFARSADNIRDHRHVTSLLNRIQKVTYGLRVSPTMTFNEKGHQLNSLHYYVMGTDENGKPPVGFFPTLDSFVGKGGDLDWPQAIADNESPHTKVEDGDQGKEAMGALQFSPVDLAPGKTTTVILFLGIDETGDNLDLIPVSIGSRSKVLQVLKQTQEHWQKRNQRLEFKTGNQNFNNWLVWVKTQPTLRKIFGNSFLPDFDYGHGGRGWRDLWQDCLALVLANPHEVKPMIIKNFGGVRIDGSNATIIGKKQGQDSAEFYWEPEFVADRNNITRTWMDTGVWPFITTDLYIQQTGDWDVLLQKTTYFKDAQLRRGRKLDTAWLKNPDHNQILTKTKEPHQGTILEHLLVQHLVQFFNVGEHNIIRLEDADWNDGLDMAGERGESVAFSHVYAGHYEALATLLEVAQRKKGWENVEVAGEVVLLLDRVGTKINYDSIEEKHERLQDYFRAVEGPLKGTQASIPISTLIQDLRGKAAWMKNHLNNYEWIETDGLAWFNGYYDNKGKRVEGKKSDNALWMTLTGQVFPILSGVASDDQIKKIVAAVNEVLWDHELGGIRLNSDFGALQPDLGRAFSFAFGEKENGAIFSHMVVMYAYALYKRGFAEEGFRALDSLFRLAENSKRSRIFPGIPEYFNNEGRGRYCYLTGSASWYVLTVLTQVFGVRGQGGDLVIAPQLMPDQYDDKGSAHVAFDFADSRIEIEFQNKNKVSFENASIETVMAGKNELPFTREAPGRVLIQNEILCQKPNWKLTVVINQARKATHDKVGSSVASKILS